MAQFENGTRFVNGRVWTQTDTSPCRLQCITTHKYTIPFLTDIKALAERLEVIKPDEVQGCTEAEIQALEDALQIQLPEAYREFLAWVGKTKAWFLRDYAWNDNYLVRLQEDAKELLEENNFPRELPPNTYVFVMHEGYNFFFFNLNTHDNPPLHFYMEGETEFRENEFDSFTDFLEYSILVHMIHWEHGRVLAEQYWRSYK
jgi:hypothetical protein